MGLIFQMVEFPPLETRDSILRPKVVCKTFFLILLLTNLWTASPQSDMQILLYGRKQNRERVASSLQSFSPRDGSGQEPTIFQHLQPISSTHTWHGDSWNTMRTTPPGSPIQPNLCAPWFLTTRGRVKVSPYQPLTVNFGNCGSYREVALLRFLYLCCCC